jgi:hypothetical protein
VKELAAAADSNAISRLNNRIASLQESLNLSAAALLACRPGKGNLNRRSRAQVIKLEIYTVSFNLPGLIGVVGKNGVVVFTLSAISNSIIIKPY